MKQENEKQVIKISNFAFLDENTINRFSKRNRKMNEKYSQFLAEEVQNIPKNTN